MAAHKQYLTFGIDGEQFALPIEQVREILDMRPIARVPHAPACVLGLTDVRGSGLLVLDLRLKFGLEAAPVTNRTRIIVADVAAEEKRFAVGLVADCVFAVSGLSGAALDPPPSIGARWRSDYIVGVGREGSGFVLVLDLDRLISSADLVAPAPTLAA